MPTDSLPCPFCGGADIGDIDACTPLCLKCGATGPDTEGVSWNDRAVDIEWASVMERLPEADLVKVLVWRPGMERAAMADVDVILSKFWMKYPENHLYVWRPLPAPPGQIME